MILLYEVLCIRSSNAMRLFNRHNERIELFGFALTAGAAEARRGEGDRHADGAPSTLLHGSEHHRKHDRQRQDGRGR